MNKPLITDVMKQSIAHGVNPARVIRLALQMKQEGNYQTVADAFAVYSSWENKRVLVDDREWIPLLIEGSVQ